MGAAELRRRARAWRNVARSATMARLDPEWVPQPHAGHFILTFRCNLKCQGCGSWEVKEHADLTADEWRRVFRQLKSLDLVKVLGGEPFVRKDIVEILTTIRDEVDPYVMQLTTNGMLTKRTMDAIEAVAWPGLQLRISVDGLEQTHDRMRGVEGSWKLVNKTVQQVAEVKDRYGFKFGINFAITDDSLNELDDMIAYAESVGADLIPGVNVDPFLVGTVPPEVRPQKVIMLTDKAAALKAMTQSQVGTRGQLPGVDRWLGRLVTKATYRQHLENESRHFPCRELKDLIYVLPNGDLVRCGLDHEPIGNLRKQRFDDLWRGEEIRAYRKKVADCPGCMQASVQIMSRVYGGCLLA
jgi:MoaA/NifB/PqqE/SkfB family radical SAM enzyme